MMRRPHRLWSRDRAIRAFTRLTLGTQPIKPDSVTELALNARLALHCLLTGAAVEAHAHTLAQTANLTMLMAELGYGAEHLPVIKLAQMGCVRCLDRGARLNTWALDGPAIQPMKDTLDTFEAQILSATAAEFLGAIEESFRRLDAGEVLQ
ncbi:MAG: hypothetical protein ACRCV9_15565 [Burkholderiaceae bacterium]